MKHDVVARTTPTGWLVNCRCGFSRSGKTRNAWGRSAAMRAAEREHDRLAADAD